MPKNFLMRLVITALLVMFVAYLLPGVQVANFMHALLVALVLSLLNLFVKPVLILFTLPVTVFTLGLFLLVINACMILLSSSIVGGFHVNGFWQALWFSIILSVFQSMVIQLAERKS